ncbi:unnamed protein product [Prorocentrum cordatum]|uniref:Uncharacterized protein n=1 Tax=Prorocentrum cordatum TaxID=2364126 RepID=A0ABN9XN60_9DINO|nr:unnamed protein product [Polarella glacialis]
MDLEHLRRIGLMGATSGHKERFLPEASIQPAMLRRAGNLLKLVAGGQTGVDQAALAAATEVGLATGGWCPFDCSDETGPIVEKAAEWNLAPVTENMWELYGTCFRHLPLQVDGQCKWARRTLLNALHSSGTVTILPEGVVDGTHLGLAVSKALGRPYLTLDLENIDADTNVCVQWIRENSIEVLNVNGPRESSSPGIAARCIPFFKKCFSVAMVEDGQVAASDIVITECWERPRFRCEEKPSSGFSPLFLSEPTLRTAAVNAGDYRLYLGGGSINRSFGDLLKEQQGLVFGKVCEHYAKLHSVLLAASRAARGGVVAARDVPEAEKLLEPLHLSASVGQSGDALVDDTIESASGAVFLDVFLEARRPLAPGNAAMLYVVGPKGDKCRGPRGPGAGPLLPRGDFLASVERLGKRALELVGAYNRAGDGARIEEVRWCLVSGGVYCHGDVSKLEVASATLRGMLSAKGARSLTVTFAYDDDVFRQACELC